MVNFGPLAHGKHGERGLARGLETTMLGLSTADYLVSGFLRGARSIADDELS